MTKENKKQEDKEAIVAKVSAFFEEKSYNGQFNGIPADELVSCINNKNEIRSYLSALIVERCIDCIFSDTLNPHIKRFRELPVDGQIARIDEEDLSTVCVYPTVGTVRQRIDTARWDDRPFSKRLALAEAHLTPCAFDLAVLERYTADPRYSIHFEDYMGQMNISDEYFLSPDFPGKDKVSVQHFGLGFDEECIPYIVVYLRYLANLTPEHQQAWQSFSVKKKIRMTEQYVQTTIGGSYWQNRSIRRAIQEEMLMINKITKLIWFRQLFRRGTFDNLSMGLTAFLRPTRGNFLRFNMELDKCLSENIDTQLFKEQVNFDEEITRPDGRIEVKRKGSLVLLEEWMRCTTDLPEEVIKEQIMEPLRRVRKARNKPAHSDIDDEFSIKYHTQRRKLLWDVFKSLSTIRRGLQTHPSVIDIKSPKWLDEEIDVF